MRRSPLRSAQADSVSVCGKMLRVGQTIKVASTAVGPRELKQEAQKKIKIRDLKNGQVQITCVMGR